MIDPAALQTLIAYWSARQGGAERANYQLFLGQLARALGVPEPQAGEGGALGDYQFEGPVPGGSLKGGTGFIDLYKRGCFILEAKQSRLSAPADLTLFDPAPGAPAAPSGARYDQLMRDARRQAEHYAHSLPGSHAPVPFLIVCDVGRAFELYFDYAGNGRGYGFFPDKQRYRIALADLTGDAIIPGIDRTAAQTLHAIWAEPETIDPRVRAADVTRKVAGNIAQVSRHLEEEGRRELKRRNMADAAHEAELVEGTALFLMRILFCMFAEDVGLLPKASFTNFLKSCRRPYNPDRPGDLVNADKLRRELVQLWQRMSSPDVDDRFAYAIDEPVRHFNGGLFARQDYYSLGFNDLDSLIDAAEHRWTNVEPAIFGTLLEQALSAKDRAKLGAHYTPRPYVERLVQATITDVLAPEWAAVEGRIEAARADGDDAGALSAATDFLAYLQRQRVLDPACGTGNFLYVAMETLLRLESDVIETIAALGGSARPSIGPANFLGLELNPRAAVIAELVLWIGWLRWRTANDPAAVPDPVLERTGSINFGSVHGYDAVLARDEAGDVAQPPRRPDWPEAEFIVGNPPFIGGKNLRDRLGSPYAEALWKANPSVPPSADFVMQWWDRAADVLTTAETPLRRFGLVTTNSITQQFSRRVIADYMASKRPLSLVMACPDHPWTKASRDAAAVRIAMTVAAAGVEAGCLVEVSNEAALDTDQPQIVVTTTFDVIRPNLAVGTDVGATTALVANEALSSPGVKLHGAGFIVTEADAPLIGWHTRPGAAERIRSYRNGRDLLQHSRGASVIDLFDLSERQVRSDFPEIWNYLDQTVRSERRKVVERSPTIDAKAYLENWWLFGKSRRDLRDALTGIDRYVATVETSKHRIFQMLPKSILPDNMLIVIASDDAAILGVLSSRLHTDWVLRTGGWLGIGNDSRYSKSKTFDPFPFPDPTPAQRTAIADLGEELDATRKAALAEHPRLTMTGLYNLVEKLRASAVLTAAEEVDARDARARIVRKLHDDLDVAVAAAYGWDADLTPAEIVARLVALNAERAAEEAAGHVRWLRPDYQVPRFARPA